jgi:hypothetical protein
MLFSAKLALLAFFIPKQKRKKKNSLCIGEGSISRETLLLVKCCCGIVLQWWGQGGEDRLVGNFHLVQLF